MFRDSSSIHLPDDYSQFLGMMNGGEGFIGDAYVRLYKLEELLEMNAAYEFPKYRPGYLLIGSNGGSEAFAFNLRTEAVFMIPFIGDIADAVEIGTSFLGYLQNLAKPGFNPIARSRSSD